MHDPFCPQFFSQVIQLIIFQMDSDLLEQNGSIARENVYTNGYNRTGTEPICIVYYCASGTFFSSVFSLCGIIRLLTLPVPPLMFVSITSTFFRINLSSFSLMPPLWLRFVNIDRKRPELGVQKSWHGCPICNAHS